MATQNDFGMRFTNSRWYFPKHITHLCIFGITGSGKSQTLMNCAQRAYFQGAKIVDLYSGGAMEGCYWSLKANHPFWKDREFKFKQQILKAQEFPVEVLCPISKNIPDELPDIFRPFTIPITAITENDLKAMLGNVLTKNEIALWRKITESFNRNTSLHDILNMIIDAQQREDRIPGIHATGISSLHNMFSTFEKHHLFSSKSCPLAINIKNELNKKSVITSLELRYFPQEIWGFIINYFIHTSFDLVLQNEIKHPVILLIREAGDFLMSLGNSSPQEEAVRNNFTNVLRKGRKHELFFWIDNQTPLNIDAVKTQFATKICHRVDNTVELQQSLGDLGAMLLT